MATEYRPNYADHPGVFLDADLKALKISQKKFSQMTGTSKTIINEIIKGKRNINAHLAVLFETYLGEPAEFWLKIQSAYDLFIERKKFIPIRGSYDIVQNDCKNIVILTPIAA